MFSAQTLPGEIFHPVPIALGEMRKLCDINSSHGIRNRELIGQSCRRAVSRRASTDTQTLPTVGDTSAFTPRVMNELHSLKAGCDARRPDFELLRPSVVIRRRPKRS